MAPRMLRQVGQPCWLMVCLIVRKPGFLDPADEDGEDFGLEILRPGNAPSRDGLGGTMFFVVASWKNVEFMGVY